MIGSSDDVDRTAPNPNRITQPFGQIGKEDGDMSELDAKERYYWSKIRQELKAGNVERATMYVDESVTYREGLSLADRGFLLRRLTQRIADTFTAGCIALGDPAPLDKEQDNG